ncbi:glycosyltransferase family 2 protein [Candidatus Roizmanbacteria bacterium]|nr:glycosyltransferase family 2 protein [Candidatus Roizmanbacteria bacterium]
MKKPEVTVIIPVFNGASYLKEAVISVMRSSYKNFEVILVDDGSKDASKTLCRHLSRKYKNVHFYSFNKNRGLGRVLNFAIKKAKGKYICRINQDDIMLKDRIKTQVNFFEKNPEVVAVGSWIRLFEENGKTQIVKFLKTDEQIKKIWLVISPFADPSVMYRKDTVIKAGMYQQEFWPGDDTHLWYRMGKIGKLANIQKSLVEVRYHQGAASVKYFRKLTMSTYRMHRWAHEYVQSAPLYIQAFWIFQFVCGMVFSADFNWKIYRILKKGLNYYSVFKGSLLKVLKDKIMTRIVRNHPKKYSFSGQ